MKFGKLGSHRELLSNLVFEVCRSCSDLVRFGGPPYRVKLYNLLAISLTSVVDDPTL
jgi:hypothetical protein